MTRRGPDGHQLGSAVAVSAAAQIAGRGAQLLLSLAATLALVRYLGPSGYGDYVFVFSFVAVFGLFSELGLSKIAVREIARDESSAATVLGTMLLGRMILATAGWGAAQLVLLLIGTRADLRLAAAVAAMVLGTEALFSIVALFQARIAFQYEVLASVAAQAVETGLILVLTTVQADFPVLVAVPAAAGGVGAAVAWAIAVGRFRVELAIDPRLLPFLLKQAVPVGLTLVLAILYLRLDGVLLGLLSTPHDVGIYGAAFKLVEYALIGAALVMNPMFPLLARWWSADRDGFHRAYRRGTVAVAALALPIPVAAILLAEPIVLVLYPPAFAESADALRVLGVACCLMILNAWQGFVLLAGGLQRATLAYDAAGLALNVVLNVALIPAFGYLGAASAALATSVLISACAFAVASRQMSATPDPLDLSRVAAAAALFGGLAWGLLAIGLPWPVALVAASVAYPAWLLLVRATDLGELRMLVPGRGVPAQAASVEAW